MTTPAWLPMITQLIPALPLPMALRSSRARSPSTHKVTSALALPSMSRSLSVMSVAPGAMWMTPSARVATLPGALRRRMRAPGAPARLKVSRVAAS